MRRGADEREPLEQGIARTKPDQWPAPIMQYLLDRIDRETLMTIAARDDKLREGQECEARYYMAQRLIAQKKPGEARGFWKKREMNARVITSSIGKPWPSFRSSRPDPQSSSWRALPADQFASRQAHSAAARAAAVRV
jgi:hypothetical protein